MRAEWFRRCAIDENESLEDYREKGVTDVMYEPIESTSRSVKSTADPIPFNESPTCEIILLREVQMRFGLTTRKSKSWRNGSSSTAESDHRPPIRRVKVSVVGGHRL
jgi:hypothetical protein